VAFIDGNLPALKDDPERLNDLFLDVHADLAKAESLAYKRVFEVQAARALVERVNRLRAKPEILIPLLHRQIEAFENDDQTLLLAGKRTITYEGKDAWYEAIRYIETATPRDRVRHMWQLSKYCFDHCHDMTEQAFFDHRGTGIEDPFERLKRYIDSSGNVSVLLNEGSLDYEEALAELVVDDGQPGRPNRAALFDEYFRFCGGYMVGDKMTLCLIEGMK
jgi:hypothetical protein